jgi:phospholipase D1/2
VATTESAPPLRTANQIIGTDGKPAQATVTSNVWVGRPGVFSRPTFGNKLKYFVTGEAYFADLIAALDAASSEVWVAGWQINWDALLAPGVRFYDLVYRNARRGVKFFVMPWDDSNPIQTYETQTKVVLESINGRLKAEKQTGAGQVVVVVAKAQSDRNSGYFSHHQKQVVIDRNIAYVGGIDIAYGRFDDATFDLNCKSKGRLFLNSYNPGLPQMKELKDSSMADPDFMTGGWDNLDVPAVGSTSNAAIEHEKVKHGAFQKPYEKNRAVNNNTALEGNSPLLRTLREDQPRQPWQDVHSRVEGPAVTHLARNFVKRWNTLTTDKLRLEVPPVPRSLPPDQTAAIQVLRSAPAALVSAERKAMGRAVGEPESSGPEDDIQTAMKQLIAKANRFIYVESQFFVSNFGRIGGPTDILSGAAQFIKDGAGGISDGDLGLMRRWDDDEGEALDRPPQNGVCAALVARVQRAILDQAKPKFHAYITLPVHPEGSLLDASVAVQVYWTMQTLAFGSRSLLKGIKRALKARELRDAKDANWQRVFDDANTDHESIDTEACFEYVTLLNLRNWQKLPDGKIVTEQVYVHTKLMIVDDLYALLGSANINDRSLLGSRDSELAVLVVDGKTQRADINGRGSNQPVRAFAHELRKDVWKKIFGITGGVRPATELTQAIEQPGSPDSWKLIQRRARANAEIYEAAFPWVPRSEVETAEGPRPAQILPTWDPAKRNANGTFGGLGSLLPYQTEFWSAPRQTTAAGSLSEVKGFITALPTDWIRDLNVWIKYPTSLIVRRDDLSPGAPGTTQTASVDSLAVDAKQGTTDNGRT